VNAAGEALDLCLRCAAAGISAPGQQGAAPILGPDPDENVLQIPPDDVISTVMGWLGGVELPSLGASMSARITSGPRVLLTDWPTEKVEGLVRDLMAKLGERQAELRYFACHF